MRGGREDTARYQKQTRAPMSEYFNLVSDCRCQNIGIVSTGGPHKDEFQLISAAAAGVCEQYGTDRFEAPPGTCAALRLDTQLRVDFGLVT